MRSKKEITILNSKYDGILSEIVQIHNITKHFILLGEEISLDFNTYLQPVKEFRDSYDHFLRIVKHILLQDKTQNADDYTYNQLDKMLGHEYRAFFDVADYFSILCRDNINNIIKRSDLNYQELCVAYCDYDKSMDLLNKSISEITAIRNGKDISGNISDFVNRYQKVLLNLYEINKSLEHSLIGYAKQRTQDITD